MADFARRTSSLGRAGRSGARRSAGTSSRRSGKPWMVCPACKRSRDSVAPQVLDPTINNLGSSTRAAFNVAKTSRLAKQAAGLVRSASAAVNRRNFGDSPTMVPCGSRIATGGARLGSLRLAWSGPTAQVRSIEGALRASSPRICRRCMSSCTTPKRSRGPWGLLRASLRGVGGTWHRFASLLRARSRPSSPRPQSGAATSRCASM